MAFLAFIHSSFRIRPFSPFPIMLLGAVCAPLAMHVVAWDTERISTYPIAGAFITFWILAETRTVRRIDNLFILVVLPALILNAFGRIPLMDYEVERFFAMRCLLLYFPAIVLFIATVIRRLHPCWLAEFRVEGIIMHGKSGFEGQKLNQMLSSSMPHPGGASWWRRAYVAYFINANRAAIDQ